jgi:hypothetical protein
LTLFEAAHMSAPNLVHYCGFMLEHDKGMSSPSHEGSYFSTPLLRPL